MIFTPLWDEIHLRPQDLVVAVEGDESVFGGELAKAVREA